jgi:serine/threonine protein phosphatase PrpC
MVDTLAARRDLAIAQHQGARPYQEDRAAFAGQKKPVCLVLCDGMGGHSAGDVAAQTATSTFLEKLGDVEADQIEDQLHGALVASNDAIRAAVEDNASLNGMGSTLVGLVVDKGRLWHISVGDSPLWVFRDGELLRLNADHSMAPVLKAQVESGELSAADARRDPRRNQLRSALTGEEIALIDAPHTPTLLEAGDLVLVASDGVETLSEDEIIACLQSKSSAKLEALATGLIEAVLEKGKPSQDNVTVCLYRATQNAPAPASVSSTATSRSAATFMGWILGAFVLAAIVFASIFFLPEVLDRMAAPGDAQIDQPVTDPAVGEEGPPDDDASDGDLNAPVEEARESRTSTPQPGEEEDAESNAEAEAATGDQPDEPDLEPGEAEPTDAG